MHLTRYGLTLIQKACPVLNCHAQPGEVCGPNTMGEIPTEMHDNESWPHGVHYSRGFPSESYGTDGHTRHHGTPRVELTEEEWTAVQVASRLRRAARGA